MPLFIDMCRLGFAALVLLLALVALPCSMAWSGAIVTHAQAHSVSQAD
jgi:hypothetical protein